MGIESELKGEKPRKASWKMDLDHEAVVQHGWKTHGSWCSCGCQLTDPLEHPCRSNAPHCSTSTPRFQWSLSRTVCAAKLQILLCHTLRNLAKRIRCPLMANWLKWTMTGKKIVSVECFWHYLVDTVFSGTKAKLTSTLWFLFGTNSSWAQSLLATGTH